MVNQSKNKKITSKSEIIELVHGPSYIEFINSMFDEVEGATKKQKERWFIDTYANTHTAKASLICTQATVIAVDKVMNGEWKNAFAATRPPGHHSGFSGTPNGFCIYNNVAIGVRYARQKYKTQKILIFDWDVHHGDGTEHIFYQDPNTLFISLHRFDEGAFYPCKGHPKRVGEKEGTGFNINVGWNTKRENGQLITPGTNEYVYAYSRMLEPIIREFKPELIFISAGYDSALGDPLGGISVTPEGYSFLTESLSHICPKVIVVLEGGYNLDSISQSAKATFRSLVGEKCPLNDAKIQLSVDKMRYHLKPNSVGLDSVQLTLDTIGQYWKVLQSQECLDYVEAVQGEGNQFITGGHVEAFKIVGDKVYKKGKTNELKYFNESFKQIQILLKPFR